MVNKEINEKTIQDILLKWYFPKGKRIACTNASFSGLAESDVLMIDPKSLLVYDYEIKISKQDFKNDFKKIKHQYYQKEHYYATNWSNYPLVPNYFYYVVPENLILVEEIPKYAGLLYIRGEEVIVAKRAPKVHTTPASNKLIISMLQNLTAKMIYGCSFMHWKNKETKKRK